MFVDKAQTPTILSAGDYVTDELLMSSSQELNKDPRRPPRLKRLFPNYNPLFLVTFNTYKRQRLLACPEIHHAFIEFCTVGASKGMIVGCYVIMPDHVHFFVWVNQDGCGLKKFVKMMKEKLGKILLKQQHDKPHWQEGFFDHLLRNWRSFLAKDAYVSRNPVRAGFCETPED